MLGKKKLLLIGMTEFSHQKKNGIELFKIAAKEMEEEYINIDFSSTNTKIEFIKEVEVSTYESTENIEKIKKYCGQIYGRFQSE